MPLSAFKPVGWIGWAYLPDDTVILLDEPAEPQAVQPALFEAAT